MQKTRQRILEYLRAHGEATVEDLSKELDNLTAVTVRHHLEVLRDEGLVSNPEARHRSSPGRPRYTYRLTDRGEALFPNNVPGLTSQLISVLKQNLPPNQVNVIFEGVADQLALGFDPGEVDESMSQRLDRVVAYLNTQGYEAGWAEHPDGWVLDTGNCPYHGIAGQHGELCNVDLHYISRLLGVAPRRMTHKRDGDETCTYLIVSQRSAAG